MFCLFIDKTKKLGNISKQASKTSCSKLEDLSHFTRIYGNPFYEFTCSFDILNRKPLITIWKKRKVGAERGETQFRGNVAVNLLLN